MIKFKTLIFVILFIAFTANAWSQQAPAAKTGTRIYKVPAKLTSYCTCPICCEHYSAGKRTATGTDARKPNGVAAAPLLVPFGSRVYIPGLRVNPDRAVDDTGGGMRKQARAGVIQFDVRARSHQEALRFGKRFQEVYVVLKDPSPEQCAFFERVALNWWDSVAPAYEAFASVLAEELAAKADETSLLAPAFAR